MAAHSIGRDRHLLMTPVRRDVMTPAERSTASHRNHDSWKKLCEQTNV